MIMRDNGPRRSFKLRRSNFFLLLILFTCLPFLCLLLTIQCWLLWYENVQLHQSLEQAEADYQAVETRAERLEKFEELLKEENVRGRTILSKQLAEAESQPEEYSETINEEKAATEEEEEVIEKVETEKINVTNVQTRRIRGNTLRISLDLRNPEPNTLLSGEVEAQLVLRNGGKKELTFAPRDSGYFRIARFKRTVLTAQTPKNALLDGARIILEVKEQDGGIIFRNMYSLNH